MTTHNSYQGSITGMQAVSTSVSADNEAIVYQANSRRYPLKDVKILYGAAAARCAFPNCRKVLILPESPQGTPKQIGKIAHIVAHSNDGPRGDPNFPSEKLDTYDNWILLCPTCHDTVDAQPELYSVDRLRELKKKHELWVEESLSSAMTSVSFGELEVALRAIVSQSINVDNSLTIIPPNEKIEINHLSRRIRNLLTMGLMQAPLVQKVFIEMEKIVVGFENRIVMGFQEQYYKLRDASKAPDEIFYELLSFATLGKTDFAAQSAGLAILSHLFEKCDVFEKIESEGCDASAN